jgi:hypothetical protein
MLEMPADILSWAVVACCVGVFAVAVGTLGLYLIGRAEGRAGSSI